MIFVLMLFLLGHSYGDLSSLRKSISFPEIAVCSEASRFVSGILPSIESSSKSPPNYAIASVYADSSCSKPSGMISILLDTCFKTKYGSLRYTYDYGGVVTTTHYTDSSCKRFGKLDIYSSSCQEIATSTDFQSLSFQTHSTNPFEFGKGNYSTQMVTSNRWEDDIVFLFAFSIDYCYSTNDPIVQSYRASWPYHYAYTTANCSGEAIGTVPIPETCTLGMRDNEPDSQASPRSFFLEIVISVFLLLILLLSFIN